MKAVVMVGTLTLWWSAETVALELYTQGPSVSPRAVAVPPKPAAAHAEGPSFPEAQRLYPADPAPPSASAVPAGLRVPQQAGTQAVVAPAVEAPADDGEPGTGMLLLAGLAMLLFMATRRGA